MTALKISSITTGDVVQAGTSKFSTANRFLGFFTSYTATGVQFDSLTDLKRKVADSDRWYALFQDCADGDKWAAYYWPAKGRWCVGSSGDRLKLGTLDA